MLGYHAGLEFLRRGYRVTALAIGDIDLESWFPREIRMIYGDLFTLSQDQLVALMKGFYAMVYAVGPDDRSVPDAPASRFFKEKLVDTSSRVFEAAAMAGVKRSVLLGSYFNYFNAKWPHLNLAHRHPYIGARVDQHMAVLKAAGSGMDIMILELPYIFGTMPNRVPLWKEALFDRLLKMNPIFYPAGGTSMICVENVAEAIAGAVEHGKNGACYPLGGQNIQWKEMFAIMFTAIGIKRRIVYVPSWIAAIAGRYLMWKERRRSKEPGLNLAYIFRDIIGRNYFLEPALSADVLGFGNCNVKEAIARSALACFPEGYKKSKNPLS